jgi:hypothetical protein
VDQRRRQAQGRIRRRYRGGGKTDRPARCGIQARLLPGSSKPRLLNTARTLYRLANENTKPDAERKSGYQQRDVPRIKSSVDALVRNYDEKVDKALVLNSLVKYAAQAQRNAAFDAVVGIKDGMSKADLQAALDKLYAGSKLGDAAERKAWLERKPEDFKASDDAFIKAAVALYGPEIGSRRRRAGRQAAASLRQLHEGQDRLHEQQRPGGLS